MREPPACLLCREVAVRPRHGGSGLLQAATQRRRREAAAKDADNVADPILVLALT
jgi:hypothetical protein